MDLVAGDTDGRDGLRTFMRVQTGQASDDEMQQAWDAMCDHAPDEILDEYLTDCPATVIEWAYTTAASLWRSRDQAGGTSTVVDETFGAGQVPTVVVLRRNRALLPRRMAQPHRTVAGADS